MRTEFDEIYRDLSELYKRVNPATLGWSGLSSPLVSNVRPLRWVIDSIEQSALDLELSSRLRSDAKHFLLVNLHQMVVLPLSHPDNHGRDLDKLASLLQSDTKAILTSAKEANPNEITSGAVLRVIASLWDKLSLNQLDIWG